MADSTTPATTQETTPPRRSEKDGLFNFGKEMGSALIMAFIAIVYVIQAFKIPTGSMEKSLMIGDFLLGLKFWYGAPMLPLDMTFKKFPGVADPKPGDVIIFKYPGADKKDYIKRCVAGPGQVVEVHGQKLTVDGTVFKLPPKGQFIHEGKLDPFVTDFAPLRIPKKGDKLDIVAMPTREFIFAKHLIHQEHPASAVTCSFDIYIDSALANDRQIIPTGRGDSASFAMINFQQLEQFSSWTYYEMTFAQVHDALAGHTVQIVPRLFLDGKQITTYAVEQDNFFMMGDNRDNSMDSRYWGFVNRNFIRAKAFILYFSLDSTTPWYLLPLKIRWDRIGKLIRPWDGAKTDPLH